MYNVCSLCIGMFLYLSQRDDRDRERYCDRDRYRDRDYREKERWDEERDERQSDEYRCAYVHVLFILITNKGLP